MFISMFPKINSMQIAIPVFGDFQKIIDNQGIARYN